MPGILEWLTGDNAGLTSEIEDVIGDTVLLRFGTAYDIQAGDTCKMRPDCDKTWTTCKDVYTNHLNFRGEPFIPLADEGQTQTPGAHGGPFFRVVEETIDGIVEP